MPKLPTVTAGEALKVFATFGWQFDRQTDSHFILSKPGERFKLSIPRHGQKNLKDGLLRGQIRTAGLTVAQFTERLRSL